MRYLTHVIVVAFILGLCSNASATASFDIILRHIQDAHQEKLQKIELQNKKRQEEGKKEAIKVAEQEKRARTQAIEIKEQAAKTAAMLAKEVELESLKEIATKKLEQAEKESQELIKEKQLIIEEKKLLSEANNALHDEQNSLRKEKEELIKDQEGLAAQLDSVTKKEKELVKRNGHLENREKLFSMGIYTSLMAAFFAVLGLIIKFPSIRLERKLKELELREKEISLGIIKNP